MKNIIAFILIMLMLIGCAGTQIKTTEGKASGLPNSVCEKKYYRLSTSTAEEGGASALFGTIGVVGFGVIGIVAVSATFLAVQNLDLASDIGGRIVQMNLDELSPILQKSVFLRKYKITDSHQTPTMYATAFEQLGADRSSPPGKTIVEIAVMYPYSDNHAILRTWVSYTADIESIYETYYEVKYEDSQIKLIKENLNRDEVITMARDYDNKKLIETIKKNEKK